MMNPSFSKAGGKEVLQTCNSRLYTLLKFMKTLSDKLYTSNSFSYHLRYSPYKSAGRCRRGFRYTAMPGLLLVNSSRSFSMKSLCINKDDIHACI